jgi:CO/xanthine dehydrogenase Mo-binding subunit
MKREPQPPVSRNDADEALAAELAQHEVSGAKPYRFDLERRDFFKLMGCGLVVGLAVRRATAQESGARTGINREPMSDDIAPWIHIAETGNVTVYTGKVEVGQNSRTSLTQQVAEELHVAPESIAMLMGDTDLTPYDAGTFGSRTTPQMGTQLRKVSAVARETLINLAAQRVNAPKNAKLTAENGVVRNPASGKSISYGELTKGQKLVKLASGDDDPPALEPAASWRIAGHPLPKVKGQTFVTGEHQYTVDEKLPDMLVGKVLRPPAFRSTLASLDDSAAKQIPNVTVIHDGNFVGVTAPDLPTAEKALKALKAEWKTEPQITEAELFSYLKEHPEQGRVQGEGATGGNAYTVGSVEKGRAGAAKSLQSNYTIAYIQHAPLEPRAAVAQWSDGKVQVWTGSQRPFAVKEELAQAFHISQNNVRVVIPDTGSAYGGKHTGEAAVEAARLAKGAGKPVKLIWTREEEFTWAYFRPAGVADVRSAVSSDGKITAWEFDNYNSGPAAIRTPYNIPNQRIQYHGTEAPPLRQGSYRGLAATFNHFARESHMDELARELKMDPLEFRLKNLADERLRAVYQAAAERFGWGKAQSTKDRAFGIAGGFEKGGYQATCVEVALGGPEIRVTRVVLAWDCGPIVNPDGVRNQIMGAIVQGLGGALFETIHFDRGKVLNPHFADYRMPRFTDTPEIDIVVIDRKDVPPFGAGETPIMGVAPAIANAVHAATGNRIRTMPLQKLV